MTVLDDARICTKKSGLSNRHIEDTTRHDMIRYDTTWPASGWNREDLTKTRHGKRTSQKNDLPAFSVCSSSIFIETREKLVDIWIRSTESRERLHTECSKGRSRLGTTRPAPPLASQNQTTNGRHISSVRHLAAPRTTLAARWKFL